MNRNCSAVFFALLCFTAEAVKAAEPDLVLVGRQGKALTAVLEQQIEAPRLTAEEWILAIPVAPTLERQADVRTSHMPAGREVAEPNGRSRSLLRARVPVTEDSSRTKLTVRVEYTARLFERRLVPAGRIPSDFEKLPLVELSEAERAAYLRADAHHNFKDEAFEKWLAANRLRRHRGETDLAFARRAFGAIVERFEYAYPPPPRDAVSTCTAAKGDCGSMCMLFSSILRASGVPARSCFGRWAQSSRDDEKLGGIPYAQYHVKGEFFAEGLGWIPVDPSVAVTQSGKIPAEQFFGRDSGDFFTQHLEPDVVIDTIHFGEQTIESCQLPPFWVRGSGSLEGLTTRDRWRVTLAE